MNEPNTVQITVTAPHGCGKSTLAQLIADRLRVLRIPVQMIDPDVSEVEAPLLLQKERLDALAGSGVKVEIRTVQTRRRVCEARPGRDTGATLKASKHDAPTGVSTNEGRGGQGQAGPAAEP